MKYSDIELEQELIEFYLKTDNSFIDTKRIVFPKGLSGMSDTVIRLFVYIAENLKPKRKNFYNAQLIELDFDTKGFSRNGFVRAYKELITLGVIQKVQPKLFFVNPYYINNMNSKQTERFNYCMQDLDISSRMTCVYIKPE